MIFFGVFFTFIPSRRETALNGLKALTVLRERKDAKV